MRTRILAAAALAALPAVASFGLAAADPKQPAPAPAPATTGTPPAAPPEVAEKPYLGIEVDPNPIDANGLPVLRVSPATTASGMGIQVGDRLVSLNGKALKTMDDLRPLLATLKLGDHVNVELMRGDQKLTLTGAMQGRPRMDRGGDRIRQLEEEVRTLREKLNARTKEPSLAEVLQQLKELEQALPAAVERFRRQYPNGEFKIKIDIDIQSDKGAKNPVDLLNPAQEQPKPPGEQPAPKQPQQGAPAPKKP